MSVTAASEPGAARKAQAAERFPMFDGLRALAALLVFTFHAWYFLAPHNFLAFSIRHDTSGWLIARSVNYLGALGVALFFMISAFLLYRPFVVARYTDAQSPKVSGYAIRRAARLLPAYWLVLLVVGAADGTLNFTSFASVRDTFLLGQIYTMHGLWHGAAPAGTWSLAVEASFYIFLPIWALGVAKLCSLAKNVLRTELLLLTGLFLLGILWKLMAVRYATVHGEMQPLTTVLPASLDLFAVGMALAVLSVTKPPQLRPVANLLARRTGTIWLLAAGLYILMSWLSVESHNSLELWRWRVLVIGYMKIPVALALILPVVIRPSSGGLPRRFLATRSMTWIGIVSYGLYLWQVPVLDRLNNHGLFQAPSLPTFLPVSALALVVVLVFAAASWYLVERYILAWAHRATRKPWSLKA
ncbi:MAG: acyltransferase [Solirubrobacterales bacterium]|nr:acyltransferase [Solirubrobacterales bacterium]